MVIIVDPLQYLESLEVDKKKVLLSGNVEWMEATYVGKTRYSIGILVRALSIMFYLNKLTIVSDKNFSQYFHYI